MDADDLTPFAPAELVADFGVEVPDLHRPFRVKWVWFTAGMGVLFCAAMAYSLPTSTWLRLLVWSVLGFIIYFAYGHRHSRLRARFNEDEATALARSAD